MSGLTCVVCNHTEDLPMHCGKPMHLEDVEGTEKLVCWMGTECGEMNIPEHCSKPMRVEE